jgi:hypothetical protein
MNPRTAVPALLRAARPVPARLRHGRPWRLAARLAGALLLTAAASHSGGGPAAITGTITGIATWLAFTARTDIAPPPGH